jgi:hypothetical protein
LLCIAGLHKLPQVGLVKAFSTRPGHCHLSKPSVLPETTILVLEEMARPIHNGNLPRSPVTSWGLEVANSTGKESGKGYGDSFNGVELIVLWRNLEIRHQQARLPKDLERRQARTQALEDSLGGYQSLSDHGLLARARARKQKYRSGTVYPPPCHLVSVRTHP